MATYKGIGYDNTSGKNRTGLATDTVDFNSNLKSPTLEVTGDASIGGDLNVSGDIVSAGAVNLVVQDPVIDLGVGNTSATALAGGFTFSLNRASSFTAETITASTNSGASISGAPELTASSASSFASGDILVLTGSDNNNGIFVVNSIVSGTRIVLKGQGGTSISGNVPFAQTQVETETGQTATAYKVDIKVLVVADGTNFPQTSGSAFAKGTLIEKFQANAVESNFNGNGAYTEVGASTSLQGAYDTGNTVTTASGNDIALTLANGNFVINGSGAVDIGFTSDDVGGFKVGTNAVDIISTGAVSIDGVGASNFTTNGDLTLSTTTSGGIIVNSVSTLDIFSDDVTTIQMDANDASPIDLTIQANNSNAGGEANIKIDADDAVKLQINGADKVSVANTTTIFNNTIQADTTAGLKFGGSGIQVVGVLDEDNMVTNSDTQLATQQSIKAYVDSQGISDFTGIATMVADETIAKGNIVAIKITGSNQGRAQLAQATTASSRNKIIGVAVSAGNAGDTISVAQSGVLGGFSGLTIGSTIYVNPASANGSTVNSAPNTTGQTVFQIGFAKSASELIIAPQFIMEIG